MLASSSGPGSASTTPPSELFAERRYEEVTVDGSATGPRSAGRPFSGSWLEGGSPRRVQRRLARPIGARLSDAPEQPTPRQLWVVQDEIAAAWDSSAPSTRTWRGSTSATPPPPIFVTPLPPTLRTRHRHRPQGQASGEFPPGPRARPRRLDHSGLAVGDHGRLAGHRQRGTLRGATQCVDFLLAGARSG